MRRGAGASRPGWLAALLGAALATLPAASVAQEPAPGRPSGWIGVGLREAVTCIAPGERADGLDERDGCRGALVVEAVFRGSPAERAGLEPGDTLLAVEGERLEAEATVARLQALAPERPARLLVGGPAGRRTVEVTPAERPPLPGPAAVWVGRPGARGAMTVRVRPRVLVEPDESELSLELPEAPEVVVEPGQAAGIRVDEEGRVFLVRGEDELVRLRRLEEIAPRLRAVRDSAFETARRQIRAVRAELRREGAPEAPRVWRLGEAGPHRVLGAEFWTVSPEMARSLENVAHGMLVLEVLPHTPADDLGIRPGDVLVRVGGETVRTAGDLRAAFAGRAPRATVRVEWIRSGEVVVDSLRSGG